MRAWQVHRHGDPRSALQLVELDPPRPGPGEVRLRVHAAALGMPDAFMCLGVYALTPPLPFVAGQEVCGTVLEVGEGVDGVEVGSRLMGVTCFNFGKGGFAEETVARAASLHRVPDSMPDVDAAGFRIGYSTAWIGLVRRGHLEPGEHLLVLGATGGSGATAVQLGKALGAHVIAVAGGKAKAEHCRALGADVVIDRTTTSVRDAVLEATGGHGADLVYDPVGGDLAQEVLRCIANEGRFLAVGFASGRWVRVDTHHAVQHNYSLVGVYAGGYTREQNVADHEELLRLYEAGALRSPVTRTVPWEDLPDALDEVATGRVIGKLVLLPLGSA
ncbi:MAG TPA: NADPH:quinone oxidoreductase family protein [Acidimicrobiales bacterium]